jgi:proteasome accessory factor B
MPASRPPLERMLQIHQAIQAGDYPNASTLARRLEVSTKSIHRDLEFMRDRLQLPLEYDEIRHGWYYTEDVAGFPTMQITEGELFALLVAEKALQQYRGTHFEAPLVSAFRKMAASLPDTISLNLADWEGTISFRTSAEPQWNLELFDTLAKATTRRDQLEIRYRKPGRREAELRMIDPYHLANINGEWYLFAYDHLRKDLRTFVPARVQSVRATGRKFERPARFSLESRLRNSFSVHSGDGEYLVAIRFDARVADFIREKKWHPSQLMKELPEGAVELRMSLSSLAEVERWILSWGGDATVLEPPELRDRVKEAGARLTQAHRA